MPCGPRSRRRPGRGGLQRRCGLRPGGLGGHRRPRARPRAVRHRRVARRWHPRSSPTAGPWPGSGVCGGARCRPTSSTTPRTSANGGGPLLPLQGEPARRPHPVGRGGVARSCSGGEPRRPRGPSSRPARRGRARGALPAGRRRASPRTTCAPCRDSWACGRGTSPPPRAWRRACPTARR